MNMYSVVMANSKTKRRTTIDVVAGSSAEAGEIARGLLGLSYDLVESVLRID